MPEQTDIEEVGVDTACLLTGTAAVVYSIASMSVSSQGWRKGESTLEWRFVRGVKIPTLQPKALDPFNARSAFSEHDPGTKFSEGHNTLVQSAPHRSGTVRGILV